MLIDYKIINPKTVANSFLESNNLTSKSLGLKWTNQENKIYLDYLEEYFGFFKTKSLRKKYEVFSDLGKKLGNRSSKQVKTHHNKMMQRFKSI